MRGVIAIGLLVLAAVPSGASYANHLIRKPELNSKATVSAGGEVFSSAEVKTVKGAKLTGTASWGRDYPAGTVLIPVSSKAAFKACVALDGTVIPNSPCFLDDDGDGVFDRDAFSQTSSASKMKSPAPYELADIPVSGRGALKRVILYQGADAGTLKLSYREFSDDMARPAFNEELSIPLAKEFPQKVAAKGVVITVFKIDGMGLTYQIDSAAGF
jgi:hypothetical protein